MGSATLRPDGAAYSANVTVVGAGSVAAAVNDDSDSSYLSISLIWTNYRDQSTLLTFGTTTIPATAQIRTVTPRIRAVIVPGSYSAAVRGFFYVPSLAMDSSISGSANVNQTSISSATGAPLTTNPRSLPWTPSQISELQMRIFFAINPGGATTELRLHEAYIDVTWNESPEVTVNYPTGTIDQTLEPVIGFDYSDAEGDVQERWRYKIFTTAQFSAPGWNPDTSTAYYVSDTFISPATSAVSHPVENNDTYRWCVQVSDTGSNGRWSAWDWSDATVALSANGVPDLVVTADDVHAAVNISVSAHDNLLPADDADFETSIGTWVNKSHSTIARSSAQAAHGSWSLAQTSTNTPTMLASATEVAVEPSTLYTAFASVRAAAVARAVGLKVQFYDSGHGALGLSTTIISGTTSTSWLDLAGTVTSPSNAAFAIPYLEIATSGAGEVQYIDKVGLVPGNVAAWTRGGLVPDQRIVVQRSLDAGTTWEELRQFDAPDATQVASTIDYEAPRGLEISYRARAESLTTLGLIASDWTDVETAELSRDTCAWIKDPLDPSRNMPVTIDTHAQSWTRSESMGTHWAGQRSTPIIVHGTVHTRSGPVTLWFFSDEEWEKWKVLQDSQRVLLYQSGYGESAGEQFYFTIGPDCEVTVLTTDDMRVSQKRRVSFTMIESAAP